MDPFTQRMIERAKARREKIDSKLQSNGQEVLIRKPLAENTPTQSILKVKSPQKVALPTFIQKTKEKTPNKASQQKKNFSSPKSKESPLKLLSPKSLINKSQEVIITKNSYSPKSDGNSDLAVEINIKHSDDVEIQVQVEEHDSVPVHVVTTPTKKGTSIRMEGSPSKKISSSSDNHTSGLRQNVKSRLDRLGVLYSDKANLSSPIHRTEADFNSATPPTEPDALEPKRNKKKFGRLAALADQINNWEDDITHHKTGDNKAAPPNSRSASAVDQKYSDESTLEVSLHSYDDINKVLKGNPAVKKPTVNECHRLDNNIVATLESNGYKRVSITRTRLVYDFSTTNKSQEPNAKQPGHLNKTTKMATAVFAAPSTNIVKKPSIKKYKAPTPPVKYEKQDDHCDDECAPESENVVCTDKIENESAVDTTDFCKQTKTDSPKANRNSPLAKKVFPKLNGGGDRNSVLSKAAMFETNNESPNSRLKDPALMSMRERKALFEKNKGTAIIPKAAFGMAPSMKSLQVDRVEQPRPARPIVNPQITNTNSTSSTSIHSNKSCDTNTELGIKGKLAALFNKEQTISESAITEKFKKERDQELLMLQNRFNYNKDKSKRPKQDDDENEVSEIVPLMCTNTSEPNTNSIKKPEIVGNVPKVSFKDRTKSENSDEQEISFEMESDNQVIGQQPVKRPSSQDQLIVPSVLDDVKRIKVNDGTKEPNTNGTKPTDTERLYPHLSDVESTTSPDDTAECGGSSSGCVGSNDVLNKSENWADTSIGREVWKVVAKNKYYEYKTPTAPSNQCETSSESCESIDSDLNELLDEALDDNDKQPINKNEELTSKSFTYKHGSPQKFRSPLKQTETPRSRHDRSNDLVHSVSFYRRMQTVTSEPSTPVRRVRHHSPEPVDDEEEVCEPNKSGPITVADKLKELTGEIAKQQTIISQASQALNLCAATIEFSGSTEQVEGERLLLLATHRRQCCVHELQRLQVEGPGDSTGTAQLSIGQLTVPLRRDYVRKLNADGAVGHHCVVMLKCRDRVICSSMVNTAPDKMEVTFADTFRMEGLPADYKVTVEVYLLTATKESLPHHIKYHINTKKSRVLLNTPVSRLKSPRVESPAGPAAVRSTRFQLHGYCIFSHNQSTRTSFTLNKVPCESPLDGVLRANITSRVRCATPEPHSAFLTWFDEVGGLGTWHRRWCVLNGHTLHYWKYPDDVKKKLPMGDVDLRTVITDRVKKAPRDLCARPNTLLIECHLSPDLQIPTDSLLCYKDVSTGRNVRRLLLSADTGDDLDVWLRSFNDSLQYTRSIEVND